MVEVAEAAEATEVAEEAEGAEVVVVPHNAPKIYLRTMKGVTLASISPIVIT